MEVEAERTANPRSRVLLLALGASALGTVLALFGAPAAQASDDDPGLLGSITAIVADVEAPLGDIVGGTVSGTFTGANAGVAVIDSLLPAAAPVTEPLGGSTIAVGDTVNAVVAEHLVTGVTDAVVETTASIIGAVPVVGSVVDALPGLPALPELPELPVIDLPDAEPVPAPLPTPPFDRAESPETADADTTDADTSPGSAAIRGGGVVLASGIHSRSDAVINSEARGNDGVGPADTPAPQHPAPRATAVSGSAAGGAAGPSAQHPADTHNHAIVAPHAGATVNPGDEAVPASPTFDSDSRPD